MFLSSFFLLAFVVVTFPLAELTKSLRSSNGSEDHYFEILELFSEEKTERKKLQHDLDKVKLKLNKMENKVAFTAGVHGYNTYTNGMVINFTRIITNIGGGLNSSDGIFYCPQSGLYSFHVTIETDKNEAHVQIAKNDKLIMYVYTDASRNRHWRTGSNTVLLQLSKGDKIAVKVFRDTMRINSVSSYFSGLKV